METCTPRKKAAPPSDWHPADIQAGLKKRGWSFRKLSSAHGYSPGSIKMALRRPWPRAERIIARAIGVEPWEIWPSRYDEDRNPIPAARMKARAPKSINPAVPFNGKVRGDK